MKIIIKNSGVLFQNQAPQPRLLTPIESGNDKTPARNLNVGDTMAFDTGGNSWLYHKYSIEAGKTYRITTQVRANYPSSGAVDWVAFNSSDDKVTSLAIHTTVNDYSVDTYVTVTEIAASESTVLYVFAYRQNTNIEVYELPLI